MRNVAFNCLTLLLQCVCVFGTTADHERLKFSDDFLMGVGGSAYQIEGAWNVSDKSESIWDHLTHNRPELIKDGSNGDIAGDFYHKYKEDIQLMKSIGANTFRFSLSWPRILPKGTNETISTDGVAFYNNLIDELLANGITPFVTIYHWDLPQVLQDLGGWTNPMIVQWITDFAEVAYRTFGDRVKLWTTVNEPYPICEGYASTLLAPAEGISGISNYICHYHVILAHSAMYHLYNNSFREQQHGKVSISMFTPWVVPNDTTSALDREATERFKIHLFGMTAHPLFSDEGGYPAEMKSRIAERSKKQGFSKSRLPEFNAKQIQEAKGTADFFAINYYSVKTVANFDSDAVGFYEDIGATVNLKDQRFNNKPWGLRSIINYLTTKYHIPEMYITEDIIPLLPIRSSPKCDCFNFQNKPWGLRSIINYLTTKYHIPEMYITENGFYEEGLNDRNRVRYFHGHLQEVLKLIDEGINLKGYIAWSWIDTFEWKFGYVDHYGLFHVDFNSTERTRTPKLSTKIITDVYKTKQIQELSNYLSSGQTSQFLLEYKMILIIVLIVLL